MISLFISAVLGVIATASHSGINLLLFLIVSFLLNARQYDGPDDGPTVVGQ